MKMSGSPVLIQLPKVALAVTALSSEEARQSTVAHGMAEWHC